MLPAGAAASGGDYDPNAASLFSCGKSRLKGRYSTEIGGSDAFYLVIESKGDYAVYRQGEPLLEVGACKKGMRELYTVTSREEEPHGGVIPESMCHFTTPDSKELLPRIKLGDVLAYMGVKSPGLSMNQGWSAALGRRSSLYASKRYTCIPASLHEGIFFGCRGKGLENARGK